MTRLLNDAPKEMHAYLPCDFQPQSGLEQEARAFQVGLDKLDMAETRDVKRRNMVRRTGQADSAHQYLTVGSDPGICSLCLTRTPFAAG